jgi:hypothetical protein
MSGECYFLHVGPGVSARYQIEAFVFPAFDAADHFLYFPGQPRQISGSAVRSIGIFLGPVSLRGLEFPQKPRAVNANKTGA